MGVEELLIVERRYRWLAEKNRPVLAEEQVWEMEKRVELEKRVVLQRVLLTKSLLAKGLVSQARKVLDQGQPSQILPVLESEV